MSGPVFRRDPGRPYLPVSKYTRQSRAEIVFWLSGGTRLQIVRPVENIEQKLEK